MNKSHVTGGIDQAVGKIKEAAGNATGDQKLANEGAAQQVKGAAKETWGNVKDSANEASATAWSRMSRSESQGQREEPGAARQGHHSRGERKAHHRREAG